jgi:hypothetical protein
MVTPYGSSQIRGACNEISEYDGCNFVILYIENLQYDLGSRLKYC